MMSARDAGGNMVGEETQGPAEFLLYTGPYYSGDRRIASPSPPNGDEILMWRLERHTVSLSSTLVLAAR